MASGAFAEALPEAGYWISREAVEPLGEAIIEDALSELTARGVVVRVLQDLWPLCNAVVASTLEFSVIRKRNARPRDA